MDRFYPQYTVASALLIYTLGLILVLPVMTLSDVPLSNLWGKQAYAGIATYASMMAYNWYKIR